MPRWFLVVMLVGAVIGVLATLWDTWKGRIRVEGGFMPTTIRDKEPDLWRRIIIRNVVVSFVMLAIGVGLFCWLW